MPWLGSLLSLALLPAATVAMMEATRLAQAGQFPMPTLIITSFRAGPQKARAMVVLGLLYALGFGLIMGLTALFDGGGFARLYLFGGSLSPETMGAPGFQNAAFFALVLYVPLSMLFWHAPALVHWHGLPVGKSLFFSLVACLKNFWAYALYALAWAAMMMFAAALVVLTALLLGNAQVAQTAMVPASLLLMAMLFTSVYFTYQGCFDTGADNAPAQ